MAVANYAASVQGVALRLTRLDAQGNPMTGPDNVYVTRAFMRVSFTPEYEEGDEVTEKNAAGEVCVTYKSNDTLKRATMEIAICDPDPEVTELLSGGVLLRYGAPGYPLPEGAGAGSTDALSDWPKNSDGTPVTYPDKTVGYATVKVGESPNPNGVGVEVWSLAIRDGARDNELPYYRWVFPKVTLRPSGDRVIENGLLANAFEGWSVGNINFGTGPADDWFWPDATDRPFLYARDYKQPWNGSNGWVQYNIGHNPGAKPEEADYGITKADPADPGNNPDREYLYYYAENPADTTATPGPIAAAPAARKTAAPPPPKPE